MVYLLLWFFSVKEGARKYIIRALTYTNQRENVGLEESVIKLNEISSLSSDNILS